MLESKGFEEREILVVEKNATNLKKVLDDWSEFW